MPQWLEMASSTEKPNLADHLTIINLRVIFSLVVCLIVFSNIRPGPGAYWDIGSGSVGLARGAWWFMNATI